MGKIPLAFSSIMFIWECCQNVGACAEQIQRTAPRNSFWDGKMEPLQLFIINPVLHHPVDGELSFVTYVHTYCACETYIDIQTTSIVGYSRNSMP